MDYQDLMRKVGVASNVTHSCHQCQQPVRCEISQGSNTCWCFQVQAKELEMNDTCLCKKCLTAHTT